MKRNIIKTGLFMFALGAMTVSCTGDLDVTPIDPNLDTPENVLTSTEAYNQLLAKCYSALSVSSPDGEKGAPDIEGPYSSPRILSISSPFAVSIIIGTSENSLII